jgi:hypothetical protein
MNILDFNPYMPEIIAPNSSKPCFRYPFSTGGDFSLSFLRAESGGVSFGENRPAVCVVTDGAVSAEGVDFKKGESFFIGEKDNAPVLFSGSFSLFAAAGIAAGAA